MQEWRFRLIIYTKYTCTVGPRGASSLVSNRIVSYVISTFLIHDLGHRMYLKLLCWESKEWGHVGCKIKVLWGENVYKGQEACTILKVFVCPRSLLRHIQMNLTRRQRTAIPHTAFVFRIRPQFQAQSPDSQPCYLPADRHLFQLEEIPVFLSFLMFLSIPSPIAWLSQQSHQHWGNAFSMVIINDSFICSWSNLLI